MRVIGLAVVLALSLALTSLAVEAQQPEKVYRIGVLWPTASKTSGWAAFVSGLQELGYVEGQNLIIDDRVFEDPVRGERLPAAAVELVRLNPDLIFAPGTEEVLRAAHRATTTIPIVALAVDFDPIARGYVASLRQPGGNITGLLLNQLELASKRLQLLKDALPRARRVAVFWDAVSSDQLKETEVAGRVLGLQLQRVELRNPPYDFGAAFKTAERDRAEAVLIPASPVIWGSRVRLAEVAATSRIPVITPFGEMAAGALFTYGVNLPAMYHYAATFVGKILKGAKPADLPVEQPTTFELVINLRTAKALGLTIPPSILLRADQVIE